MLRPSPAAAGLAFLLAGCGPNDVILGAFQHAGARGWAGTAASP